MDSKKREKTVVSCTLCRSRKLRCDRQSPCSACVRRNKASECIYLCTEQERKDAVDYRPRQRGQQIRQRIARLESLVTEMKNMSQDASNIIEESGASTRPLNPDISDSMGRLSLNGDQAVYIGSSHWATILEDIQQLKNEMTDDESDGMRSREMTPFDAGAMPQPSTPRITLLTSASCPSKEYILSMVPPRQVVDRHISLFFNNFDLAPFVLHRKIFLTEYSTFWTHPANTPTMWLGLLFSIMAMSVSLQHQSSPSPSPSLLSTLETYRTLTISSLISSNYLQPTKYTIETLTLHFAVDQVANLDTDLNNWVLMGVIIRLALRIGLHRDPSHWPSLTPLHSEIRRRLWTMLYQMDFFTSTQVGLPRIIKDSQCDTRPPTHLFDDDLAFSSPTLPPARPASAPSALSYIIHRATVVRVAAAIYDATEAGPPSQVVLVQLGAELDVAIESIPEWLRMKALETAVMDDPAVVLQRMFLDILVQKAVYMLYRRRFMVGKAGRGGEREEKGGTESVEKCVVAALAILEHQRRIHEETQVGGVLYGVRARVAGFMNHEFLQAVVMLCLVLKRMEGGVNESERREEIVEALRVAKTLWEEITDRSTEARRAVETIEGVLGEGRAEKQGMAEGMFFDESIAGMGSLSGFEGLDFGGEASMDLSSFGYADDLGGLESEFESSRYATMYGV